MIALESILSTSLDKLDKEVQDGYTSGAWLDRLKEFANSLVEIRNNHVRVYDIVFPNTSTVPLFDKFACNKIKFMDTTKIFCRASADLIGGETIPEKIRSFGGSGGQSIRIWANKNLLLKNLDIKANTILDVMADKLEFDNVKVSCGVMQVTGTTDLSGLTGSCDNLDVCISPLARDEKWEELVNSIIVQDEYGNWKLREDFDPHKFLKTKLSFVRVFFRRKNKKRSTIGHIQISNGHLSSGYVAPDSVLAKGETNGYKWVIYRG